MSKQITINAPFYTKGKFSGHDKVTGRVAWLYIGSEKHKCFIQTDGGLSDYATGGRFGVISDGACYLMSTSHGTSSKPSQRAAAQALLDMIVARYGVDRVQEVIAKHEVINQ
jgi:hypothetical protein